MIDIHLPIVPPKVTSQTKRVRVIAGRPMFFPKKEHQQAEHDLIALIAPYAPACPLDGPVKMRIDFRFPWRKSETRKRRAMVRVPCDVKPDLDNMAKLIGDVLTKLQFYRDDGQVADLRLTKSWGDDVGIRIVVGKIEVENKQPQLI